MAIKLRKSEDGCLLVSDPYIAAACLTSGAGGILRGAIPDPERPGKKLIKIEIDLKKADEVIEKFFQGRLSGQIDEYATKLKEIRWKIFDRETSLKK